MIGKNFIEIGAADFVRGMSTDENLADGGFSPETEAVNLITNPGVLHMPAEMTDKSTNLTGDPIAHCSNNIGTNGFILDDDGVIYSVSATQVLAAATGLTGTWTPGKSDIVQFIDKIYATSDTDVAQMATNLTGGDHDWWSATQSEGVLTSGVPHPLCIFQDRMWIGDSNALHRATDASNTDQDVLVLSAHHVITALGVDPSSGKMLIATTQDTSAGNYSATLASQSSIFSYDGTSATYTREYVVDGIVTGFHTVGGIVFVAYGGNKIGYWNGSGITYLHTLRNVTLAGADLPYKHHMAHIDNTLYIVDGTQVLAYGEVLPGQKVWYYAQKNSVNSNNYKLLCNVGNKKLGLGFTTSKFYTFDTSSIATASTLRFNTNRYTFPRPVYIRGVYIEYDTAVTNNDSNRSLYYMSETQGGVDNSLVGSLQNSSGASVYSQNFTSVSVTSAVRMIQLRIESSAVNTGWRRIVIYYDVAE